MLIKCENCSIEYEVPEERLTLEKPLFFKCISCGHVFAVPQTVVEKEETTIPPVEQSDVVPMSLSEIFNEEANKEIEDTPVTEENNEVDLFEPLDRTEEFMPIASSKQKNYRVLWTFITSVLTCIAIVYLLYVGRYFFVRKAPITEPVYQKVGISTDVTGEGLAFQDTLFEIGQNAQNYELLIKSQITNTTDEAKTLPTITVRLIDKSDTVVQTQKVDLPQKTIESGAFIPFEVRLNTLADTARKIEMTFEKDSTL